MARKAGTALAALACLALFLLPAAALGQGAPERGSPLQEDPAPSPLRADPSPPQGGSASGPLAPVVLERPEAREACREGQEEARSGRRRAALEAFRRGLRLDPERIDCRASLATLLLREFRWREAEAEFRAALTGAVEPRHRELLLLGLGEALERRGQIARAAALYEEVLRTLPDSPRALGHLAIARRRAGDLEGAVSAWKAYLEEQPRDSAAVERLEEVLRLQAELRLLDKEARGPEADSAAWEALARARRAAGDLEGALAARRAAAERAPGDAGKALSLALALRESGRPEEARRALERVVRLDPERAVAYAHLARLAEEAEDRAGERRAWERLLERHPLDPVAPRRLVEIGILEGTLEREARSLARQAAKDASGAAPALRLALARAALGDAVGAEEAFALALERSPAHPAVQASIRDYLLAAAAAAARSAASSRGGEPRSRRKRTAAGGPARARDDPEDPRAERASPRRPVATGLGHALLDLHRASILEGSPLPIEKLAGVAERQPARAGLRVTLGDALAFRGRVEEAKREYLRALEADGGEVFAHLGLALLALGSEDLEAAERRARLALERRPRDSYALATLANILYRGERMEGAAAAARAALEIDPWDQSTSIRFLLARALGSSGDLRAAEEAVRGEVPRAGWLLYDQAWEFARDLFLQERPAAFWETWRRRPGQLGAEEVALARVADLLASLEERYTRLRTPEESLERYFSRRPDSPELVAGRTSDANRAVIARRLGENLAYLRLADFQSPEIAAVVRQILEEMADAPGLVLDLRGNPGGLKDEARKVAEMLLPPETPLEIEQRRGGASAERAGPQAGIFADRPLVVLVDEGTASAAESLASMLQASGRATLVGDTTRGKGVSQAVRLLPGGYSILVTAGQSLDPAGRPLEGRGVVPQAAPGPSEGADPALEKARELLLPRR